MVAVVIFSIILFIAYMLLSSSRKKVARRQAAKVPGEQKIEAKRAAGLIAPAALVPWKGNRPTSWKDYESLSADQQGFFDYFIDSFCENEYWDLNGNDNYAFLLMKC